MMKAFRLVLCLTLCMAMCMAMLPANAEIVQLPIDLSGGLPFEKVKNVRDVFTYDDPSIHVERHRVMNQETDFNCNYYWADITIANATQLRTAPAGTFERTARLKVETMAKRTNAVVAINGDYYGARTSGYVLRQGVEYKDNLADNLDVLLIDEDGDFHVILAGEEPSKKDKTTWNGKKVINGFCFGPALIVDNEVVLNEASSPTMSAPESQGQRMCIIQTGPLQYTVLCCIAVGCTAKEMVDLVFEVTKGKDVKCAYLLDGGESSQMCFLGYIVNKENRRSREISDIIYFASAWQPEE